MALKGMIFIDSWFKICPTNLPAVILAYVQSIFLFLSLVKVRIALALSRKPQNFHIHLII